MLSSYHAFNSTYWPSLAFHQLPPVPPPIQPTLIVCPDPCTSVSPPQDKFNRTALHWAAEMGHDDTVEALLDFNCDIHAMECNGR